MNEDENDKLKACRGQKRENIFQFSESPADSKEEKHYSNFESS